MGGRHPERDPSGPWRVGWVPAWGRLPPSAMGPSPRMAAKGTQSCHRSLRPEVGGGLAVPLQTQWRNGCGVLGTVAVSLLAWRRDSRALGCPLPATRSSPSPW